MTPCRWASGFRRFEGTCCLSVRRQAVHEVPSTDIETEGTAIIRSFDKRRTVTSHSPCTPTKLLIITIPPLFCPFLSPSSRNFLAVSRLAFSYRLSTCVSDVKRTSEKAKSWVQPRSIVFNIPFRAGDYELQFSVSVR